MAISKTKIFKKMPPHPQFLSGFPLDLGIKVGSQKKDWAIYTALHLAKTGLKWSSKNSTISKKNRLFFYLSKSFLRLSNGLLDTSRGHGAPLDIKKLIPQGVKLRNMKKV